MGGECSLLVSCLTLGQLYDIKSTKGRINWLIFIVCKVMTPALLVMVTDTDEIKTYKSTMMTYYKKSLKGHCTDLQSLNSLDFDHDDVHTPNHHQPPLTLQELLSNEIYNENTEDEIKPFLVPNAARQDVHSDKKLGATLQSYLTLLEKTNKSIPLQLRQNKKPKYDVEYCCENYRRLASEAMSCMREQEKENGGEMIPFPVAMFLPCLGAILVALLLASMKRIYIRKTFTARRDLTTVSTITEEPSEKLENVKYCLHFIVDIVVFYVIVHKIKRRGTIMMGSCAQNRLCLPKYTSLQMIYLLTMAQTPWISILWNFVY